MKCEVKFSDGTKSYGIAEVGEKDFAVYYKLDNDDCSLVYKNGALSQRREGSLSLYMEFIEGSETALEIGGELSGFIPIYCEELKITHDCGFIIYLKYKLGEEEKETVITVKYM